MYKKILMFLVLIGLTLFPHFAQWVKADTTTTSTSIAQQQQAQQQGMYGSGNSGITNSGNSGVTFKDSFNGSKPIRHLPNASGITYSGMAPQMFSRPGIDKGAMFIASNNLIGLMGSWVIEDLADDDFDVNDVDIDITTVGNTNKDDKAIENIVSVDFAVQGSETQLVWKNTKRKVLAIGTVQAGDTDINSAELFMALAIKAKLMGATAVTVMGEGVESALSSFGWGIGFSYNMASVDSDGDGKGSVGAGGTGISGGSAEYSKKPYLTFGFLD